MSSWFTDILSRIGTAIGAFISGFFVGKLREQKKEAEKERDNAIQDSKAWKNRPNTDADVLERLRKPKR